MNKIYGIAAILIGSWLLIFALNAEPQAEKAPAKTAEVIWFTNYEEALKQAAKENKPLLLEFTGSDWCPPCMALKTRILSSSEFKEYAKDKLILLELDFPNRKKQSKELKKQNEKLAAEHKVEAFPTIILLSAEGKKLGESKGFGGESAKKFIERLDVWQKR